MTEIIHMGNVLSCFAGMGVWGQGGFGAPGPTPASEKEDSYFLLRFVSALLAHGFAIEFQAIGVVNDAVEYTVGHGNVANLFMPMSQGHLRSQDQGTPLITVITDFQ